MNIQVFGILFKYHFMSSCYNAGFIFTKKIKRYKQQIYHRNIAVTVINVGLTHRRMHCGPGSRDPKLLPQNF